MRLESFRHPAPLPTTRGLLFATMFFSYSLSAITGEGIYLLDFCKKKVVVGHSGFDVRQEGLRERRQGGGVQDSLQVNTELDNEYAR